MRAETPAGVSTRPTLSRKTGSEERSTSAKPRISGCRIPLSPFFGERIGDAPEFFQHGLGLLVARSSILEIVLPGLGRWDWDEELAAPSSGFTVMRTSICTLLRKRCKALLYSADRLSTNCLKTSSVSTIVGKRKGMMAVCAKIRCKTWLKAFTISGTGSSGRCEPKSDTKQRRAPTSIQ